MPNPVPWWANSLLSTVLAVLVAWVAISFDRRKTVNQELIRKRIAIYEEIAPRLNDMFCFLRAVGNWKDLTPPALIEHKRALDRLFNLYGPLFSERLLRRYNRFITVTFAATYAVGETSKLKAPWVLIRMEWGEAWPADWNKKFVEPDEQSSHGEFGQAYWDLMDQFAIEIGAPRRHRFSGRWRRLRRLWPFRSD